MKQTREVTIIRYRRLKKKKKPDVVMSCPRCGYSGMKPGQPKNDYPTCTHPILLRRIKSDV